MKKLFIIVVQVLIFSILNAQAPQKMSYQAVIRDNTNNLITNDEVGMRVSILQGDTTGIEVFKEIYNPNPVTNSNGLVSLEIGSGIPVINSFESIDWGNGPLYIKIETDPTGGTNYTVTGISQLLSVPYALYSKTSENNEPGWSLTGNTGTVNGVNFIGTIDNQPLDFRTNNLLHTRISTKGQIEPHNTGNSVFIGLGAGNADDLTDNKNAYVGNQTGYSNITGENNTAIGNMALHSNTTGHSNVAYGGSALYNNTVKSNLVAVGDSALYNNGINASEVDYATRNTAIGSKSLYSNTTGSNNTAIGSNALFLNNNNYNTAIGSNALFYNANNENTAIGFESLFFNDFGSENTAIGNVALYSNTSGFQNTAVGKGALSSNSTGSLNVAYGTYALSSNTSGDGNTAIGRSALQHNYTGYNNTAIGEFALADAFDGHWNTALGYVAFPYNLGWYNSTALGFDTYIGASNQVRLGNSSVTSIGGYANWSNISDVRFKKEIQEMVHGLDFILKLRPIIYHLDLDKLATYLHKPDTIRSFMDEKEKESIVQTGFSAQDVEEAANSIGYDFSGVDKPKNEKDLYGLRYAEFVVPLVKAVQEQQAMIEDQKRVIQLLQNRVKKLEETK
ncbi:MAG: tail fiber domain-containing protein [Bacteroidota bacterium]